MEVYKRVMAEIDLDELDYNIKNIQKRIGDRKIIGVVKADAYGHGAVKVSEVLQKNGVMDFAVSNIDEAIELRKNGIKGSILILGYTPNGRYTDVLFYNITQAILSFDEAKELSDLAMKLGIKAKIEIKIDTGMGRIGFMPDDSTLPVIEEILALPNLEFCGIFSHFSTADEKDKTFRDEQEKRFREFNEKLVEKGIISKYCHIANSAEIIDDDNIYSDYVRPGIILYGLYPSSEVKFENLDLKPVMSIKTHISFIKEMEENMPIGYGRTYYTKGRQKIATVPIGYADGFLRSMQKGGRVLVNGQFANVVGRVCMDQFMIDVTHIEDIKVNDEVVILGKQGDNEITADEIAKIQGTICYEVVCLISKRVPRVYKTNIK